ncbi:unnamed protein product [Tuber aestivum]|uniref:C2H2-type domain-containing protein n=1 Tax=Tuber aestivum TaxID=59557 RepID=A0A292PX01_9PEZI|nr:unnamed protein product [Tuber aestivum]
MPPRDEISRMTECRMCGARFQDPRATKKHLKKTRHFVKMEREILDSYRPSHSRENLTRDGRNRWEGGCVLRARFEYGISRGEQTWRRPARRSLGRSRSRGGSKSPESSSPEYGGSSGSETPQGRGVGGTRECNGTTNGSGNGDGPVEQSRSLVSETPQGRNSNICATTAQPGDCGSVTSAISLESSSDPTVGPDLDTYCWEEQRARYPELGENRST